MQEYENYNLQKGAIEMEINKVTVKIHGQDYTIAGDKPVESILRIADLVDKKMSEIQRVIPLGSVATVAVLSAVNIADEFFSMQEEISELISKNEGLEKDTEHYIRLWDEAKKSFLQHKDEAQSIVDQKEEMQRALKLKSKELDELKKENVVTCEKFKESSYVEFKELESKYKDIESSFFDLQMENIQLKGELERYKKLLD